MHKSEIGFKYRSTKIKNQLNFLILYAIIIPIIKKDPNTIQSNIIKILEIRKTKLPPTTIPNIGCIFKNSIINGKKISAARLIEDCFQSGYQFKNLALYEKHFNIIIHQQENASSEDFENMIRYIKEKVFLKHGILLDLEVQCLF